MYFFIDFYWQFQPLYFFLILFFFFFSTFFAGPPDKLAEAPYEKWIKMWFWGQGTHFSGQEDFYAFSFSLNSSMN